MSHLSIMHESKAQAAVESLHKDLERRVSGAPHDLCPLDIVGSYIKVCTAQTCGKCVPCRVSLPQMERLIDGKENMSTAETIPKTA